MARRFEHFSCNNPHSGYECEAFNNPPDFFLDIINGDSTAVTLDMQQEAVTYTKDDPGVALAGDGPQGVHVDVGPEDPTLSLTDQFKKSTWNQM